MVRGTVSGLLVVAFLTVVFLVGRYGLASAQGVLRDPCDGLHIMTLDCSVSAQIERAQLRAFVATCDLAELRAASREWAKTSARPAIGVGYFELSIVRPCHFSPTSAACARQQVGEFERLATERETSEQAESRWRRAVAACP